MPEATNQELPLHVVEDESSKAKTTSAQLKQRESKELIIAYSGAVGSGVKKAVQKTKDRLEDEGYSVKEIRVSDLIREISTNDPNIDVNIDERNKKERYEKLQDAGNGLRLKYSNEILAELVVSNISILRKEEQKEKTGDLEQDSSEFTPSKTAYLIDQLKHPSEVELLKTVYGNLFFLIGILACEEVRKGVLKEEELTESEAADIMERDRKEDFSHGQQLEKTLQLADFFIRDNHSNEKILSEKIDRFIRLIHGYNGITPTNDEYGMYAAFSASLKSACLSRQVGASIADKLGNIITTGCNDVPRANGGLYYEGVSPDNRCVHKGKCFNDKYKDKLCSEISNILSIKLDLDAKKANDLAIEIKNNSRLKDLIEYSRSVHAEMDAITSVAREGGVSVEGGTLYSTTFPCHSCARHIIASGIKSVVYIEPYEKSLARRLHGDDISYDPDESDRNPNKVIFMHFEGVSPKQYMSFFCLRGSRKDQNGDVVKDTIIPAHKVAQEYLDNYREFEKKVIKNLDGLGLIPED